MLDGIEVQRIRGPEEPLNTQVEKEVNCRLGTVGDEHCLAARCGLLNGPAGMV